MTADILSTRPIVCQINQMRCSQQGFPQRTEHVGNIGIGKHLCKPIRGKADRYVPGKSVEIVTSGTTFAETPTARVSSPSGRSGRLTRFNHARLPLLPQHAVVTGRAGQHIAAQAM